MPRTKRELTPYPAAKCWKKYRKGRVYYVGKGLHSWGNGYRGTNTSCSAYQEALEEWRRIDQKFGEDESAGIDTNTPAYQKHLAAWRKASQQAHAKPSTVSAIELAHAVASRPAPDTPTPSPALANAATFASDYSALPTDLAEAGGVDLSDTSVNGLVRVYLAEKRADVEAGQISPKMYAEHKGKLRDFQGFAKHFGRVEINGLDSDLLSGYRREQLRLATLDKAKGGISKATARKRLQVVKRWAEWAYKRESLDNLPRVLMGDFARIKLDPPDPEFYTVEEIHTLYKAAPPMLQGCILLALNAGYYQTDISSLEWSMIDADTRIVYRKRQKTNVEQSCRLWPHTFRTLRRLSRRKSGLVLTGPKGVELVREEIGPDGNLKLYDRIGLEFRKLQRALKVNGNGKGFSTFRNSAANEIAKQFQEKPWLTDQFLGHSIGSTKKHYVQQHFDELHAACDYLGTLYALDKIK